MSIFPPSHIEICIKKGRATGDKILQMYHRGLEVSGVRESGDTTKMEAR